MKQEKIFACEKCGIPLTMEVLRKIEDHIFCYFCSRKQSKLNTKEGGNQNEEKNFEN